MGHIDRAERKAEASIGQIIRSEFPVAQTASGNRLQIQILCAPARFRCATQYVAYNCLRAAAFRTSECLGGPACRSMIARPLE
jgi:hypothetical protein